MILRMMPEMNWSLDDKLDALLGTRAAHLRSEEIFAKDRNRQLAAREKALEVESLNISGRQAPPPQRKEVIPAASMSSPEDRQVEALTSEGLLPGDIPLNQDAKGSKKMGGLARKAHGKKRIPLGKTDGKKKEKVDEILGRFKRIIKKEKKG